MPYLPLDSGIVEDPTIRPQTLHDYTRLLLRAWKGHSSEAGRQRPLETRLTLADLQALFGHAGQPLAASNVYRRMAELKAANLIDWTMRRGEYVLSFPRATLDPQEWAAGAAPKNQECAPAGQELTPTNQEFTPKNQESTPENQEPAISATPKKQESTPTNQECTPKNRESGENTTPKKQESTPANQECTPKNQESAYVNVSAPDNPSGKISTPKNQESEEEDILINTSSPGNTAPAEKTGPEFSMAGWQPEKLCDYYVQALKTGGVYPGIRRHLSAELAETEGAAYLPHLLGLIAFARSDQCQMKDPGACVRTYVQERESCPEEYWPPSGLTFEQLLLWARAGQPWIPPSAEADPLPLPATESGAETEPEAAEPDTPAELPSAEAQLWKQALAQMKLELSKSVFETWVRPTRLIEREGDTCIIGAPSHFAKDWLENRLTNVVRRTLSGVARQPMQVRFVATA